MSKKNKKKSSQPAPRGNLWFSSSDDGEEFSGFSKASTKHKGTNLLLQCHTCKHEYSIKELQMPTATYWLLQNLAEQGARWHCTSCLNAIPVNLTEGCQTESLSDGSLKKLTNVVKKVSKKMDILLKDFKKSSNSQKTSLKSYADAVSQNLSNSTATSDALLSLNKQLKSVETNISNKFEMESEQAAKDRKALNVCIFNVPESVATNPEEKYKDDIQKFKEIVSGKINIEKEDVKAFYRIGLPSSSKCRPIILKTSNKDWRNNLLKLRNLVYKSNEDEIRIFINPDRTKKEQESYRKLLSELKQRQANGEQNIGIRNSHIVFILPFRPNPQTFWGSN